MTAIPKITGQRFGRLTVLKIIRDNKGVRWECVCDCGTITMAKSAILKLGRKKSCGCLQKERIGNIRRTHGMHGTTEYASWQAMKDRCYNPKNPAFPLYGGRGISVHSDWIKSFSTFFDFIGPKPAGDYSIDRIDVNGNYEPGNCRWATPLQQARNQRGNLVFLYQGIAMGTAEFMTATGLSRHVIYQRRHRRGLVDRVIDGQDFLDAGSSRGCKKTSRE